MLAKKVLEEIPGQVVNFFQTRNIQPNPRQIEDKTKIHIQQQLQNQLRKQMNYHDTYYIERKIKMHQELVSKGYDPQVTQAWIDYHGVPEYHLWWPTNCMQNPNFVNYLQMRRWKWIFFNKL